MFLSINLEKGVDTLQPTHIYTFNPCLRRENEKSNTCPYYTNSIYF